MQLSTPHRIAIPFAILVTMLFLPDPGRATQLQRFSMSMSGRSAMSTNFTVRSTAGQSSPIGMISGGSKIAYGGYWSTLCILTAVSVDQESEAPLTFEFGIARNYPNPFNPRTTIEYTIPSGKSSSHVILRIYDPVGRLVRTLVNAHQTAGLYSVTWDGTDKAGREVSSGVYFGQLSYSGDSQTRRLVLVR